MKPHGVLLAALLALTAAGCKEDPTGPPIPTDWLTFNLRDIYSYENGALVESVVEFEAVVSDSLAPATLDSIVELDVTWPNGVVHMEIPVEFHERSDGRLSASTRVTRQWGLFGGTYELTVRFEDGEEEVVERGVDVRRRLDPPTDLSFTQDTGYVRIGWTAPRLNHQWSAWVERRSPEPVEITVEGLSEVGYPGSHSRITMGYEFQPDETYAAVLELRNEQTVQRVAYLFQGL